ELGMAVVGVPAHQVPQDGPVADVHQRLRDRVGMLAQARAEPAAKQHYFQVRLPSPVMPPRSVASRPASSSAVAAPSIAPNGKPERAAIASRSREPSAWLSTHSRACWKSPGAAP